MSYLVHLNQFEGPLGLLLYLIRKEEMDIFDINVNDITKQYLDYIRMMKELDLEVAGEFVAMAATLIHIKSRMLLPQYDEQGEVVEVEDPRKELVQKLLDYQRFQEAAKKLYERPLLNRDVFSRGIREDHRDEDIAMGTIILDDEGLFSLIASYRRIVRKAQKAVHKVRPKVQSIASRVMEIGSRLVVGSRIVLRDLLSPNHPAPLRTQLLITFLSVLELGRMGFVSVFQTEVYGDIHIEAKKPIERNVLERVQEFDSADSESIAKSIINEALEERIDMSETMMSFADEGVQLGLSAEPAAEELVSEAEMASDEEILAAEAELEGAGAASESFAASETPSKAQVGAEGEASSEEQFDVAELEDEENSFIDDEGSEPA